MRSQPGNRTLPRQAARLAMEPPAMMGLSACKYVRRGSICTVGAGATLSAFTRIGPLSRILSPESSLSPDVHPSYLGSSLTRWLLALQGCLSGCAPCPTLDSQVGFHAAENPRRTSRCAATFWCPLTFDLLPMTRILTPFHPVQGYSRLFT